MNLSFLAVPDNNCWKPIKSN